jgi:hypothetical protein
VLSGNGFAAPESADSQARIRDKAARTSINVGAAYFRYWFASANYYPSFLKLQGQTS